MSYLALARKWRPKQFSEVVGQDHVVSALSNALDSQRVHHAFLFTGTRGVGKTTLARIFAKALNCETGVSANPCGECVACQGVDQGSFVDLIEVDAASRTRVDDTRELLDNVQYTPTQGRYKIYLIDEVHMLSINSFNALLKTLEEPPEHVKFLLATTNPQKLPTTILSRCIQFNLKTVDLDRISGQLEKIITAESVEYEPAALTVLARAANGSVRDSLSLLDQAIAYTRGNLTGEQVREMLGMIDDSFIAALLEAILKQDADGAFSVVETIYERSADYLSALDDLLVLIHNVALYQHNPAAVSAKGMDGEETVGLAADAQPEVLQLLYQIGVAGKKDFDFSPDPRTGFEMMVLRMLAFTPRDEVDRTGGVQPAENTPKKRIARPEKQATPGAKPVVDTAAPIERVEDKAGIPEVSLESSDDVEPESNVSAKSAPVFAGDTPGLAELMHTETWQNFIEATGLGGISREILMNMSPREARRDILVVSLDDSSRHLFNEQRKQKIESHLREIFGSGFALEVSIEDMSTADQDAETPTRKIERIKSETASMAVKTFSDDQNVQEIIDLFDAKIVPDSIKPGAGDQ